MVLDEFDKGNNVFLDKGVFIVFYRGVCGYYVSLGKFGDILLEDIIFRGKFCIGIIVVFWVNFVGLFCGYYFVFSIV